ncbi:hypothetical protein KAU33_15455 [Candidatus Dependentiae bacterium]|nr:hypothetical protein [Candidatus Dependentiae bacterium]
MSIGTPIKYSESDIEAIEAIEASLASIEQQIKITRRNIEKHPGVVWISIRELVWKSRSMLYFIRDELHTEQPLD